jgi:uncharacterized protein YjiS (DUF1127 family)
MTAIPYGHSGARHSRRYRINDGVQRVLATLQVWAKRIRDRRELARLDDRMLKDIGITRADALYASEKPFWKE